ncbi:MAG TPA: IPT/TIG domain-containing protein [Vicinamibacterales bacterium]|nr:IPT/TIG domain-containing protein [Vicinamibacterales bacterium]
MTRLNRLAALTLTLAIAACGGGPSGPEGLPTLVSIAPATGSVDGGTRVRLTGSGFSAGASVFFGDTAAIDVGVDSPDQISATTPPHAAGDVDVAVVSLGARASLPSGFAFVRTASGPPVITSLGARGTRANEPSGFADLGESILVAAAVTPDDAIDASTFQWSAPEGVFGGTGPSVTWQAPGMLSTPATVLLQLVVSNALGQASGKTSVSVHDSPTEIGDLARQFLLDFSDSTIRSADTVLRNFSTGARCSAGRSAESDDIADNRRRYEIQSHEIGAANVTVAFASRPCSYMPLDGDGCAVVHAVWDSVCIETNPECTAGERTHVEGFDYVTAVYEPLNWRLCASYFQRADGG